MTALPQVEVMPRMTSELTPLEANAAATVDPKPPASSLERGLRIRRLRLLGPAAPNTVDFVDDDGNLWPLSVIAGRTNTGKTSVLRFIEYVLGAKDFPAHREVLRQVRTAALEIETPDGIFTLERALESNRVHVYPGPANDMDPLEATTLIVQPPSDPGASRSSRSPPSGCRTISAWYVLYCCLRSMNSTQSPFFRRVVNEPGTRQATIAGKIDRESKTNCRRESLLARHAPQPLRQFLDFL